MYNQFVQHGRWDDLLLTTFEAWTLNATKLHQPGVTAHLAEQLDRGVRLKDAGLCLHQLLFPVPDHLNTGKAQNDLKIPQRS